MVLRLLFVLALIAGAIEATAQNSAAEFFDIGYSYQTGEGVERDEKRALTYYAEALRENPDLFAPLYNTGLIYHDQGEYTRAQNYFITAAKASSSLGDDAAQYEAMARNGLGTCYQQQGNYENAEKQFDIARRMQSDFVEAHYNYINILVRDERLEEATAALKMAESMAPSDRYEKFKGLLLAKQKKEHMGSMGGAGGLLVFILLVLAYGMYLRRAKRR